MKSLLLYFTIGMSYLIANSISQNDMIKANNKWHSLKESFTHNIKFQINGYHQNRINKITTYLQPKIKKQPKSKISIADIIYNDKKRKYITK